MRIARKPRGLREPQLYRFGRAAARSRTPRVLVRWSYTGQIADRCIVGLPIKPDEVKKGRGESEKPFIGGLLYLKRLSDNFYDFVHTSFITTSTAQELQE